MKPGQKSGLPALLGTAGAMGTLAWLVAVSGPEFMARAFWVAAPIRILTSYVDLPARVPALRHAQGSLNALSLSAMVTLGSYPSLLLGMTGIYTEGKGRDLAAAPPLRVPRLYLDLQRCRGQLWWWSSTVAGLTFLATGSGRRAFAVMLAGSPSALITAMAIFTWRELRHWEQKRVELSHPLALMSAGEVRTLVFDLPNAPAPDTLAWLRATLPRLAAKRYRTILLTTRASPALRTLADHTRAELWETGNPAARASWVRRLCSQTTGVAVAGLAPDSAPVMAAAGLAVAVQDGQAAGAHVVVPASPAALPDFLAASRRSGQTVRTVITASRSLAVVATVATAAGLLAATNAVTVANIIGLGAIALHRLVRGQQRPPSSRGAATGVR